ncbi:hypothetical protein LTR78_007754 [Recurvomyces mirabilis]|uniref:Mid2 domain-containing protein n=1 Tax=Recurvomyces mirabilis TaxID=574656 RepID=A0AAE0TUL6_9PEZI|nr:hypothetical protein LTR78_007754 [Recurvomyces mirabilis]KAK5151642.1 hypothetical protein LTS14_009129 [Recurvomyces mirabilis]
MSVFRGLLLLASLAFFASPVIAQDGVAGNDFTSPGPQIQQSNLGLAINFQYGQNQTFRWVTNVPSVMLSLWQQQAGAASIGSDGNNPEDDLSLNNTQGYYNWNGIPTQNLKDGITFFLQIYDSRNIYGGPLATSQYFNISSPPVSSSSAMSSTMTSALSPSTIPTSTTAGISSGSPPTVTVTAATASPSPTPARNDSMALGVGIGVGLGGALLLALLVAGLVVRKRQQMRNRAVYSAKPDMPYQ